MKKKKKIWAIIISIVIVCVAIILVFFLLNDKNKLTIEERAWIDDNINAIQNVNVVNNANVFGKNGSGVFYDFLNDFSLEYGLKINPITFNSNNMPEGLAFGYENVLKDNDIPFYQDHYVLISKDTEVIKDLNDLKGKVVGINSINSSYVSTYLNGLVELKTYENDSDMFAETNTEVTYFIVPLMQYLDTILSGNYNILFHFSDISYYFVMQTNDTNLSKVLSKYFNTWENGLKEYFYDHEFTTFTESLGISEIDVDKLQGVVHNYGFVNNSPYEVIMGGKYGGIISVYLSNFSDFSDIEFKFMKYKNLAKFKEAIKNKEVEVYFNYYNLKNDNANINGPLVSFVVASLKDDVSVVNSLNSLINKTVYVEENSKLQEYLSTIKGINLKTYETLKDFKKQVKKEKDYYLVMDKNVFTYNNLDALKNYDVRYTETLNDRYTFKVNDNSTLANLFNRYVNTLDSKEEETLGLLNHDLTVKSGSFMSQIARYIIYLLIILLVIVLILVKKSRKIKIARRIKKDDKMKFIDQLTSLKNRNFLSENISIWNNNTIYPQAIVVIDLNRLQEINDVYGYEEGDKQIQAAASALIKTQLDNSEIMRTDGNEFVIYIVGYSEKQVINYIFKLNKEMKKLPYKFGAEFGKSMIMDNIKTVEDAMNEAVEDMKKQKANDLNEKENKR